MILNPTQRLIQHITETTDLSLETVYFLFYLYNKMFRLKQMYVNLCLLIKLNKSNNNIIAIIIIVIIVI